jgi:hypothetical protein
VRTFFKAEPTWVKTFEQTNFEGPSQVAIYSFVFLVHDSVFIYLFLYFIASLEILFSYYLQA